MPFLDSPILKAHRIRGLLTSLLACASLTGAFAATSYRLTDLGAGVATDVNNSGHVAGTTAGQQAFFFNGVTNRLIPVLIPPEAGSGKPFVSATSSQATAINDSDVLAVRGYSDVVLRSATYGVHVGTLTNSYQLSSVGIPVGINNSGDIVGTLLFGPSHDFTAGIWDSGAVSYDYNYDTFQLGFAQISAINDAGLAVGSAAAQVDAVDGPLHPRPNLIRACIFRPDGIEYLDSRYAGTTAVDSSSPASHLSDAFGINAAGHVVGAMSLAVGNQVQHAFRSTGSGFEDLGTLGGIASAAVDINSDDQVVGTASLAAGQSHAFVWQGGVMTDLNTLLPPGGGWVLTRANAINDRGEIAGTGTLNGIAHAFLLSPGDVAPALSILVHPVGATLDTGESYTLSVTAQGEPPLTYQWQLAGTNLAGATQSSFIIASATALNAGSYLVTVRDGAGNSISDGAEIVVRDLLLPARDYFGLTMRGIVGATYRVECTTSASDPVWTPLTTLMLTSTNQVYLDPDSPAQSGRLYRAVRQP